MGTCLANGQSARNHNMILGETWVSEIQPSEPGEVEQYRLALATQQTQAVEVHVKLSDVASSKAVSLDGRSGQAVAA